MLPEFKVGDIVVVKEVDEEQLKEGDIISYRDGQNVVTHRIIEDLVIDGERQFKTKGDNNNVEDDNNVKINSIEGKVLGSIPFIGNITILLRGKISILIMIILFYFYFVQSEKVRRRKEERRIKRIKYEQKTQ